MYNYAFKRLVRGKGLFLALFLSIFLATILFSGILQGADAIGTSMLNKVLDATDVDFVSSAENRNLTKTSLAEVEVAIKELEHVVWVEHLIRSTEREARAGIEVRVSGINDSMPFTLVAIAGDSRLLDGIEDIDQLELGKVYVDKGSINASLFYEGQTVTLQVPTYAIGGSVIQIENRYINYTLGGIIEVDDRLFSIALGRYATFLRSSLVGSVDISRRPPHQLIFISEETFLDWMGRIYGERRRHTRPIIAETIIGIDRSSLLNTWNIAGSKKEVNIVFERINSLGARFGYVPQNYLGDLLDAVDTFSSRTKTTTLLLTVPVFFIAWYLGMTVSDITLGLRRREIGLLLTRGSTTGQVFYIFLFEALLVSLLAGVSGIIIGAMTIPLVSPSVKILDSFRSISSVTLVASFIFSCTLAIISVYRPAKKAIDVNVVDALREHQSEEEYGPGSLQEPVLAVLLGIYRVVMLILGLTVEQFRPTAGNFIIFILYSTWWGVDFILTYIAPILLFWGFTKLFVQYTPWLHNILGRFGQILVGDISLFSTLSARRNSKKAAASTFMVALILGYSVFVVGSVASTNDFTERFTRLTIGADASVWLFRMKNAETLKENIVEINGVGSATVETWLAAESSLGLIPVRIINPLEWAEIAYIEEEWMREADAFDRMNESKNNVIMEKGAAKILGVAVGSDMLIKLGSQIHTFTVVGFFGRDPGPGWSPQNPTLYIPDTYFIKEKHLLMSRILVKLEQETDLTAFKSTVEELDPDIEGVDIVNEIIKVASSNILLSGSRRIEELGVYFANIVASIGVIVIVLTALRSRLKELSVMAIRGLSYGQLTTTLLVENIGLNLFSILLGIAIGFIMLRGETIVINATNPSILQHHIVFPFTSQLTFSIIVGLLIISTVVPILLFVRHISINPLWRTQE